MESVAKIETTEEVKKAKPVRVILGIPQPDEGVGVKTIIDVIRDVPGPYPEKETASLPPNIPIVGIEAMESSNINVRVHAVDNQGNISNQVVRTIKVSEYTQLHLSGSIQILRAVYQEMPEPREDGEPVSGILPDVPENKELPDPEAQTV